MSQRGTHFLWHLPRVTLKISKNNFVFQSSSIWNKLIVNILHRNLPVENVIVVKGSLQNSDLCTTLPFVKKNRNDFLQSTWWGQNHTSLKWSMNCTQLSKSQQLTQGEQDNFHFYRICFQFSVIGPKIYNSLP